MEFKTIVAQQDIIVIVCVCVFQCGFMSNRQPKSNLTPSAKLRLMRLISDLLVFYVEKNIDEKTRNMSKNEHVFKRIYEPYYKNV